MSTPTVTIAKQARAYSDIATITNVQLPGIIPDNNNNLRPSPPSGNGSVTNTNTNPTNNSPQVTGTNTIPPIVHRNTRARTAIGGPTLNDPNLKVEQIINRGFDFSTSMAFLGPNDLLVLEKNTGIVHRIV
ncbi:MAG: hypothetical protein ACJ71R_16265, partial [Nitrososphaeraceae archaeon]